MYKGFVSLMLVRACRCWPELASGVRWENPGLESRANTFFANQEFVLDRLAQKHFARSNRSNFIGSVVQFGPIWGC
jgi:hypothetical protein